MSESLFIHFLTYDADKGLKVFRDYGNVHTEVLQGCEQMQPSSGTTLDGSFSRDPHPHGDEYLNFLYHISWQGPHFLLLTLILVPCLHPSQLANCFYTSHFFKEADGVTLLAYEGKLKPG